MRKGMATAAEIEKAIETTRILRADPQGEALC